MSAPGPRAGAHHEFRQPSASPHRGVAGLHPARVGRSL